MFLTSLFWFSVEILIILSILLWIKLIKTNIEFFFVRLVCLLQNSCNFNSNSICLLIDLKLNLLGLSKILHFVLHRVGAISLCFSNVRNKIKVSCRITGFLTFRFVNVYWNFFNFVGTELLRNFFFKYRYINDKFFIFCRAWNIYNNVYCLNKWIKWQQSVT